MPVRRQPLAALQSRIVRRGSEACRALGVMCGLAAGAWLGAAEAPTKLVRTGVSPVIISLLMVIGVFLARWKQVA